MSAEEREALAELIWTTSRNDESTISATGANHIADALLAAGWTRPVPDGDAITFKLADPDDWSDDWCCVCGSEDVAGRRGLYLLTDGSLGRTAWCSECLEDRAGTDYLPIPERLRAGLLARQATTDGQANTCSHSSATGIDQAALDDPAKVWACDHCGLRWTAGHPEATRSEAETVTTVAELAALSDGSLIRDHMGDSHFKDSGIWFECGYSIPTVRSSAEMVAEVAGVFRVLHRADQITNEGDE